jgi:alkaline phosphatase D
MKKHITGIATFVLLTSFVVAQSFVNPLLQSGPMLGYADMREAMIWVQTTKAVEVYAEYAEAGTTQTWQKTNTVVTESNTAFTARLNADKVEPGRIYNYRLFIDNKEVSLSYPTTFSTPPIWRWRGDPPEFAMLTGSCAYINESQYDRPGNPYGGDYRIFTSMANQKADFMLWLGDNVYLREPDWNTRTGFYKRYTHTRSLPELQPFLASTHHYAIWDDHDYGPDNSNKSFFNKNTALETFNHFWGNPTYGTGDIEGAITSFQWGDADFFLLDNRWYRDPDEIRKDNKTILGEKQLEWLLDNLVTSRATFKVVAMGGQFLSDAATGELYSANGFQEERLKIINFIYEQQIKNVVFLTGDVHFSEISVLKTDGKPTIYDLTFSTMSAGVNTRGDTWKNTLRMTGTVAMERNFGKILFSGPAKARTLKVSCYSTDNRIIWEKTIDHD